MKVPFMDVKTEHRALRPDLLKIWEETLESAAFVGGPAVEKFEAAFAKFCEVRHAIGVGNGTDALTLALAASDIGAGDEVVLPANTFVATAEAVVRAGARPVLVDVDPSTYLIDVEAALAAVTPATRAIVPVHLYGQLAPVEQLRDGLAGAGIAIVEDAAQCQGATR